MRTLFRLPLPFYAPEGAAAGASDPAPAPAPAPAVNPAVADPAAVAAVTEPAKTPEPAKSALNQVEPPKDGDKPAEPAKKDGEPAAPFTLDQLKLPEGLDAKDPSLTKFAEIVGNDKLSAKDRAQALIDLQAEISKGSSEALTKQWNDTQLAWQGKVKADPEIGGDKLQPTLQMISKGIDGVFGPELGKEFRSVMDFTGAGNHPAVVKGLAKVFATLTEGGHVPGDPSKGKLSTAQVFFPNSPEFNEKGNG